MAVLRPLRVVIDNYPEDQGGRDGGGEQPRGRRHGHAQGAVFAGALHRAGRLPGSPPKQFYRLSPGREVRLRYGYFIACTGVVKDEKTGEVVEIHCTYDPATHGGNAPDGRKVKSTIHWVSAAHAIDAEVRLYDNLFTREDPNRDRRRRELHRESEPALARSSDRRQAGAFAAGCGGGRPLSVRAAGLLLRRSGFRSRQAGLQPDGGAAGYLGQNREGRESPARRPETLMIILGIGGILGDAASAI
jgi:hypothetical protein